MFESFLSERTEEDTDEIIHETQTDDVLTQILHTLINHEYSHDDSDTFDFYAVDGTASSSASSSLYASTSSTLCSSVEHSQSVTNDEGREPSDLDIVAADIGQEHEEFIKDPQGLKSPTVQGLEKCLRAAAKGRSGSDGKDYIRVMRRVCQAEPLIPDHPLAKAKESFERETRALVLKVKGEDIKGNFGRHLESYCSRGVAIWNWSTTRDPPGVVMQTNNRCWSPRMGRRLGFADEMISVVDIGFDRYSNHLTGKYPLSTEPPVLQAFMAFYMQHEQKALLELGSQCILVNGVDAKAFWDFKPPKMTETELLSYEAELKGTLNRIYGEAYDRLRHVKIVQDTFIVEIPIEGLNFPHFHALSICRLEHQPVLDSSVVIVGHSMAYLLYGGLSAALDILSSTALFHVINGSDMPNMDHLLKGFGQESSHAFCEKVSQWSVIFPLGGSLETLELDDIGAFQFMLRNLNGARLRARVEAVLDRDLAGEALPDLEAYAAAKQLT